VLRFANFLGPGMSTPMSAYFELPIVPTVLGFDPRIQLCHEDDGLDVLRRATVQDHPGTYNVAGDGVMLLSQAIRRSGKPILRLPAPLVSSVGGLVRRARLVDFSPEQLRFLTYGRGVDTTRMRSELGFSPQFSTMATFDDFAKHRLDPLVSRESVEKVERAVLDALTSKGGTWAEAAGG
jgi:UDP-glucose 4-epimerase